MERTTKYLVSYSTWKKASSLLLVPRLSLLKDKHCRRGIFGGGGDDGASQKKPSSSTSIGGRILGPHPVVPDAERIAGQRSTWKNAASIILAAPDPVEKGVTNFLVMKRSKGSSVAPNTLCFPGGTISPSDLDKEWVQFFKSVTHYDVSADLNDVTFLSPMAVNPPMYQKIVKDPKNMTELIGVYRDQVSLNVAFRLAAIRELFEECGILLARPMTKEEALCKVGRASTLPVGDWATTCSIPDAEELQRWQALVRKEPKEFMNMCYHFKLTPDLNSLVEWSNWLTPNSFGIKRFDTIFYMATLKETVPFVHDPFEVATLRWTRADLILNSASGGRARIIPPQIYELTRLRASKIETIRHLMKVRLSSGIERWCPCYFKATDGAITALPGDDLYPDDYQIGKFEDIRELQCTMEEARKDAERLHRIEFKSPFDFELFINVKSSAGQVYFDNL